MGTKKSVVLVGDGSKMEQAVAMRKEVEEQFLVVLVVLVVLVDA
jgi:hypothetical protein